MSNASSITQAGAIGIAFVAIVGAVVAVCLGKIDSSTFVAVLTAFGGFGAGAGVHAAGVTSGSAESGGKAGGGGS